MSGLTMFQLYLILVLLFFDGMIAVTDHPDWFDGSPSRELQSSVADR
jgi:hypothetical protein